MNKKKRKNNYSAVLIVAIMFLSIASVWACTALVSDKFSDKEMSDLFIKNQNDFDTLAKMSDSEDNVVRVADAFTRTKKSWAWPRPESEWGISQARWDEYKLLFNRLGIKGGMDRAQIGDSDVWATYFVMRACGHFSGCNDREKGYVHSTSQPQPLVESIDNIPPAMRREDHLYMQIAPDWYIYENRE